MDTNAALALLDLSTPPKDSSKGIATNATTQTPQSNKLTLHASGSQPGSTSKIVRLVGPNFKMPSTLSHTVFFQQVKTLYDFGYRSDDLRRASYPEIYVKAIVMMHTTHKCSPQKEPPQFALTSFHSIPYYTSSSPHVKCPYCETSVVICKNGELRAHHCRNSYRANSLFAQELLKRRRR